MKKFSLLLAAIMLLLCFSAPFSVCAEPAADTAEAAIDAAEAPPAPDSDYVTRGRAVYILMEGLGDELKAVMPADLSVFADYDQIDPMYYDSLGLAVALGILGGSDDGMLHPNDYITRVESFAIVSRVLAADDLPTDLGDGSDFFTDVPKWAEQDIARLKNAGLVYGYGDGTLGSDDYILYDQIVLVYGRMLEFRAALPSGELYKEDYYAYVNEQWLSETALPAGYAKWSNVEQIAQNNTYRIQNIIGDIISDSYVGDLSENGSNEQKILDIYMAASNEKYREQVGIEPIRPYLEMIDGINGLADLPDVLAELEKAGFHSLIPIKINTDFMDSTQYRLSFEACYTGIEPGVVKSGGYDNVRDAYREYVRSLFFASGQQPAEAAKNAESVVNLCVRLAEETMDEALWNEPEMIYNVYSADELKDLFSNIGIVKYIKNLGYDSAEDVVIYDRGLARAINHELRPQNVKIIKQYLKAAVLDSSAMYLNSELFDAYRNYINAIGGTDSKIAPSAYAVTITQSLTGMELGEEYVERYFSAESKKEIEDLADLIIKTFEKRIDALDWMSGVTKEVAKDKLEAISVNIGYPEYIKSYKNDDFSVRSIDDGGNLMEYVIDYNLMLNDKNNELINSGEAVDKSAWSMTPQSVNAYYDRAKNCIVIPAGVLQAPYYSPNASFETNLGGIGSVIAHEITHAFDDVGSRFDKNGNYRDWWLPGDYSAFNEMCRKFVAEYGKIEALPGCFVDGSLTLSENIADVGAVACILDIAGADNPNLDELFKTYARTYRTVCTDEYAKMLLATDVHAPNRVRVNMVLSNFGEFLELYHMQPGCAMYRDEKDRLKLW